MSSRFLLAQGMQEGLLVRIVIERSSGHTEQTLEPVRQADRMTSQAEMV
jgi:hypothetical protein